MRPGLRAPQQRHENLLRSEEEASRLHRLGRRGQGMKHVHFPRDRHLVAYD